MKNKKQLTEARKLISKLMHEAKRKKWGKDYAKVQAERMAKMREAKARKREERLLNNN